VRQLKTILILLLAALWLPASNHCRLEIVSGLEFISCASGADTPESGCGGGDCAEDACALLESGDWRQPESLQLPSAPQWVAIVIEAIAHTDFAPTDSSAQLVSIFPPPELPKVWQFHSRTALPPRAPDCAS